MVLRTRQSATDASIKRHFFINRAFGLLWSGQTISVLGSHITGAGIPLIAILVLGASPAQVGLLAALSALPSLLFSLPIGVWVDRVPRRPLLILTDLVRALLLLSLPLASLNGLLSIEQLAIVTVVSGICTICFDTAYRSFLPQVVVEDQLVEGNSKLGTSSSLAEMGGPPLAGGLVQWIGAPLAVLFDALSFLVSALCIALIRPHEIHSTKSTEQRGPLWRELSEGFHVLFGHPLLRILVIYATVSTFFGGAFIALYTMYIVRELNIAPVLYGVLVALGGIGALVGSLVTPAFTRRFGAKKMLFGGVLVHSILTLISLLVSGPLPLVFGMLGIAQLIGDIGYSLYTINEISLFQSRVPARVQGRVIAVIGFLIGGIAPFGTLLAGVLSEFIGIRLTLLCGAGGMFLMSIWFTIALSRQRE